MPWYYAGPEAKPVGPLSTDELHALRVAGTIAPETYVIEHTDAGAANLAWKRYREVFPAEPTLPAIPVVPLPPVASTGAPLPPATVPATAHPLFPSAAPVVLNPAIPTATGVAAIHAIKPTNSWCAWGFGLGLAGFFFAWVCGIGVLPALLGLVLSIIGLVQVNRNREQGGHVLGWCGLGLSIAALLIGFAFICWMGYPIMKAHGLTVTEQTSNDSE